VSGKGTRFILANTEQLHTKIHEMSERIRRLEEALEVLQSQCSTDVHPLLRPEYLSMKSTMGLYGGIQAGPDAPSTPSENGHDYDAKPGQMEVDIRSPDDEVQKSLVQEVRTSPRFARCGNLLMSLYLPRSRYNRRVRIHYLQKLYD
jgi:hypothetical protein